MSAREKRFEAIAKAHSSDLYRYALMLSRNEALAEDLVQETLTRAWRFLDKLRDDSKAKSWLMTTVRREFARTFERYRPVFDDVDLDTIAGVEGENPEIWTVRRAMLSLSFHYREVLTLQVIGEYNGTEIAEMLDLPRATVNTRLFRARQQLREILKLNDELETPRVRKGSKRNI